MWISERFRSLTAPVLDFPVLVVESDDWGPGPETQAEALDAIRSVLSRYRDRNGRPPVMTIGVVLSIPDPGMISATGKYHAQTLDQPDFRSLVGVLRSGVEDRVFALQLHGMAHFWPANLMAALDRDPAIRQWLNQNPWQTERLPAWLQSRWIDAESLPSGSLPAAQVTEAVNEEIQCFQRCFGDAPKVVVPPTFVWDETVERAYANAGIEVLITPGQRFSGRDREGKLTEPDRRFGNGEQLPCGLKTLVRNIYFEPAMGHSEEAALDRVAHKWARREPALLETHRFNFDGETLNKSLSTLDALLEQALKRFPDLHFMSPQELVDRFERFSCLPPLDRLQTATKRLRQE